MGCPIDDPAALAAELSQLEVARWRTLLPPIAAANGKRVGVDLNITAREFGASLLWTVNLESGSRREGVTSTADCPGDFGAARSRARGSPAAALNCRIELPPGHHELDVKIGGGPVQPLSAHSLPARML